MENYRIYYEGNEKADVLAILEKYNDIIIDNSDGHSVGITIERDDAETFYRSLLEEIEREVYALRLHPRG